MGMSWWGEGGGGGGGKLGRFGGEVAVGGGGGKLPLCPPLDETLHYC